MTCRDVTWALWSAIALLLVAIQVAGIALAWAPARERTTCSGWWTASPTRRATPVVLGWLWLGWHTFAR